jgi:hypothetical protein
MHNNVVDSDQLSHLKYALRDQAGVRLSNSFASFSNTKLFFQWGGGYHSLNDIQVLLLLRDHNEKPMLDVEHFIQINKFYLQKIN